MPCRRLPPLQQHQTLTFWSISAMRDIVLRVFRALGEAGHCLEREAAEPGKSPGESRPFCVSPSKPASIYYSHTCFSASHRKREHPEDGPSQRPGLPSERRMRQGGGRAEGEGAKGGQHGGWPEEDLPTSFPYQQISGC